MSKHSRPGTHLEIQCHAQCKHCHKTIKGVYLYCYCTLEPRASECVCVCVALYKQHQVSAHILFSSHTCIIIIATHTLMETYKHGIFRIEFLWYLHDLTIIGFIISLLSLHVHKIII